MMIGPLRLRLSVSARKGEPSGSVGEKREERKEERDGASWKGKRIILLRRLSAPEEGKPVVSEKSLKADSPKTKDSK